MRTLVTVVVAASFAVPSVASAQGGPPMCPLTPGPTAYQPPLLSVLNAAGGPSSALISAALGPQFTGLWLDTPNQGWAVAVSPGPLDVAGAKAAILAQFGTQLTPEQVAYAGDRLTVHATPYAKADLEQVQRDAFAAMQAQGWPASAAVGCGTSDGYRVQITRFIGAAPATPELEAETAAVLAPFGDKVRFNLSPGIPAPAVAPAPAPARPAVRVRDYASVPRCVRGDRLVVRASKSSALRSVTISAGKRRASARAGGKARLTFKARRTRVAVTVRLRDGSTATEHHTVGRC
jgi:hypothetical protein